MSKTLKYKGFHGSIDFDLDTKIMNGKVLFIQDFLYYEGKDLEELEKSFQFVVDDYLETCEQLGIEARKPCSGQFNVRIDPELHYKLNIEAAERGMKLNPLVSEIFTAHVNQKGIHIHTHNHKNVHEVVYKGTDTFEPTEPMEEGAENVVNFRLAK